MQYGQLEEKDKFLPRRIVILDEKEIKLIYGILKEASEKGRKNKKLNELVQDFEDMSVMT